MTERRTSRAKKLGLVVLSLVVSGGLAELANRWRLSADGRPYDAQTVREELRLEAASVDQLTSSQGEERKKSDRVLNPFTAFDMLGTLRQIEGDVRYFDSDEAEEGFEILLLGGSVANGFGRDAQEPFLDLLREDARFAERPLRLLRYARPSFKQPQQLNSLNLLLAYGLRPDAVINLDGFNEVAVSNNNRKWDAHPLQPSVAQWGPYVTNLLEDEATLGGLLDLRSRRLATNALAERGSESSFLWCSFVGSFYLDRVRRGRQEQVSLQAKTLESMSRDDANPVISGPEWTGDLDATLALCVENWKQASISMDAICDRHGIHYLHVLQPTLHAPGARTPTPRELEKGDASDYWLEAAREGYPRLIAAGRELTADGVHFLDATPVFDAIEDTVYIDACHFNADGQKTLAGLMSEAFLASHGK